MRAHNIMASWWRGAWMALALLYSSYMVLYFLWFSSAYICMYTLYSCWLDFLRYCWEKEKKEPRQYLLTLCAAAQSSPLPILSGFYGVSDAARGESSCCSRCWPFGQIYNADSLPNTDANRMLWTFLVVNKFWKIKQEREAKEIQFFKLFSAGNK